MKQNLKRILPVLLVMLVIASMVWYLFVYDRDFTRDMLIELARYSEKQGNPAVAAWLYDRAYEQSGGDEKVAIELAQQFIANGNYTKAEYTLANAIADGGSADLYIALCKTYVQQGKLKDAVTMLDRIADPTVKAQLEAMRPAAPVIDTEPGNYSEYLTVTVTAPDGGLLVSTDRSYPAGTGTADSASVTLVGGENFISALSVSPNGLVSPLSTFKYTVGGVVEELVISDSAMDSLIRKTLGYSSAKKLLTSDLWTITKLTLPKEVLSSADLAFLPYLQELTVENSTIADWSSLEKLPLLTKLTMVNCTVSTKDLQAIGSLKNLTELTLSDCGLANIDGLKEATQIVKLDLSNNSIRNLAPLSFYGAITHLNLSRNALEDLNSISSLGTLQVLDVSNNLLESIAPLASCTQLRQLIVSGNKLQSLGGIVSMTLLEALDLSNNALTDVTVLAECLTLRELNISRNGLTDISMLSALTKLEVLDFSDNQVTALPAWEADCALTTINGNNNQLTTISTLAGYANLNSVLMDHNKITSVSALINCPHLMRISIFGNPAQDVEELKDAGIIVHYTPKV